LVEFIGKSTFDLVDHGAIDAMKTDTTAAEAAKGALFLGDDWFDPLKAGPACAASFVHGPWSL
jgi:hypothetical protein